ncbi:MAG: hypothetical protein H6975_04375 [Gammaproteobacteria bacterium]|nr:hypothetical protein [Gammaproteobacteria bacterium]
MASSRNEEELRIISRLLLVERCAVRQSVAGRVGAGRFAVDMATDGIDAEFVEVGTLPHGGAGSGIYRVVLDSMCAAPVARSGSKCR